MLELGPGSRTPIVSKTLPFLKALKQRSPISIYKAIDATRTYAELACDIIQDHFSDIQTEVLELNFLSSNAFQKIEKDCSTQDKKLIVGFGQPFFANNNEDDIKAILTNIATLMHPEDHLLFGADMNNEENIIESAYSTMLGHQLLLNVMHYLKDRLGLKGFDPEAFTSTYRWDAKERSVVLGIKAQTQQIIKIKNQKITIAKNQYLNLLNSKKPDIDTIKGYLANAHMTIKDIISLKDASQNKFRLILAQKSRATCV